MIYIYILREIGSTAIRWVGQTNDIKRRLRHHKCATHCVNNPEKLAWVRAVNRNIEAVVIETVDSCDADDREAYWIKHYREAGCQLLNRHPGGKTSRGFKPSDRSNEKRSKAMKGKHHTDATKKLLSEVLRNNPKVMKAIQQLGRQRKGKPSNRKGVTLSPETRLKISLNSSHHPSYNRKLTLAQELEILEKLKHRFVPDVSAEYAVKPHVIYDMVTRRGLKLKQLREGL